MGNQASSAQKLPGKEGKQNALPCFPYIADEVDRHTTVCDANLLNLRKQRMALKAMSALVSLVHFHDRIFIF